MNRINLLPDHFIESQRRAQVRARVMTFAVAAVVCGIAWGGMAWSQFGKLSARVATATAQLEQERQRTAEIELRSTESRKINEMLAHRAQLQSRVAPAGVLTLLTHLLPDSVALTRLSLDVPPPDMTFHGGPAPTDGAVALKPPSPEPTRVVLEGMAMSDVELAQVVSTLAGQKAFSNVKLLRSRQVPLAAGTRFGFEISLDIPPAVRRTNRNTDSEGAHHGA